MASLKYCDKHNQVGFLKKPEERAGFAEIVDFLKSSHIRLRATIDTLEYIITEVFVRSKLQLADASGIFMLPNTEIFEGMGNMGRVPRPLLPAMLPGVNQSAGPTDQVEDQPLISA
ncbi:hypothetical protein Tco_1543914 [Tanacetum coccineum]